VQEKSCTSVFLNFYIQDSKIIYIYPLSLFYLREQGGFFLSAVVASVIASAAATIIVSIRGACGLRSGTALLGFCDTHGWVKTIISADHTSLYMEIRKFSSKYLAVSKKIRLFAADYKSKTNCLCRKQSVIRRNRHIKKTAFNAYSYF
jgi:hypothetical protein